MANNNRCGCGSRRHSNSYGCLDSVNGRWRWDNFPFYPGPCPDAEGDYGGDCGDRDCRRCRKRCCGQFTAMLPMAVIANGIIPLGVNGCLNAREDFGVNSGLITVRRAGTYLATYTVRAPEGAAMDTTVTLNVNDASQSAAISDVGGTAPFSYTAQALIEADAGDTVTLRSSKAISLTESDPQPLFTLSLVKLD